MPIYEFRCEACGKVSEFQMKISDPHPTDCPLCTQPQLRKIMSLPSFQLKGGGWYSDSYDGKSNKKSGSGQDSSSKDAPKSSSDASSASSTSSPAKSESAPATPAPTPAKSDSK